VRARSGFSLIEVLVAAAIFTFLMLAVTQSLIPLFHVTRETRVQTDANQEAQALLERIRSEWRDKNKYDKSCVDLTLPANATVQVQKLDQRLHPMAGGHSTHLPDCSSATPDPAPVKRVTVEIKDRRGRVRARLSLDIPEPKP